MFLAFGEASRVPVFILVVFQLILVYRDCIFTSISIFHYFMYNIECTQQRFFSPFIPQSLRLSPSLFAIAPTILKHQKHPSPHIAPLQITPTHFTSFWLVLAPAA